MSRCSLTSPLAEPQACLDHHGQRHPHDAALLLDAELVGLHLPQVPRSFDQALLHRLPLATGKRAHEFSDGPLVKAKSRHDRLHRTPMGQQGHHEHHGLCRGAQAIEDRTSAGAEGFVALVTDESLLLPRMDTNVALASSASAGQCSLGQNMIVGSMMVLLGCVWKHAKRSMSGPPFLLQVSFTTVKWRATTSPIIDINP